MKFFIASSLVLSVLVIVATSPVSAGSEKPGSGPNPYRDCGIGAALFSETHWAAVTSNVIWDLGTTAVTSATSSPETCSGDNVQAAQFIIDNYDNLVEETAQGHGEYLTTVLDIKGCEAGMQDSASKIIRAEMAVNISSLNYESQDLTDKASDYFSALKLALSTSCSS